MAILRLPLVSGAEHAVVTRRGVYAGAGADASPTAADHGAVRPHGPGRPPAVHWEMREGQRLDRAQFHPGGVWDGPGPGPGQPPLTLTLDILAIVSLGGAGARKHRAKMQVSWSVLLIALRSAL